MVREKKIGGHWFALWSTYPTKRKAKQVANRERRRGLCVRVIHEKMPWERKKTYSVYRGKSRKRRR